MKTTLKLELKLKVKLEWGSEITKEKVIVVLRSSRGWFVREAGWPFLDLGRFTHVTKGHEGRTIFGFVVLMVGSPKTMTKSNLHHFLKVLGKGHSVKHS